ncbi:MAG TPA: hypothetical protein VIX19_09305 [Terriglobales bacterium]
MALSTALVVFSLGVSSVGSLGWLAVIVVTPGILLVRLFGIPVRGFGAAVLSGLISVALYTVILYRFNIPASLRHKR